MRDNYVRQKGWGSCWDLLRRVVACVLDWRWGERRDWSVSERMTDVLGCLPRPTGARPPVGHQPRTMTPPGDAPATFGVPPAAAEPSLEDTRVALRSEVGGGPRAPQSSLGRGVYNSALPWVFDLKRIQTNTTPVEALIWQCNPTPQLERQEDAECRMWASMNRKVPEKKIVKN